MTSSEDFCNAMFDARYGIKRFPEPYAQILRIAEHIRQSYYVAIDNTSQIETAYREAYEILIGAWSQLSDELCIQEDFYIGL